MQLEPVGFTKNDLTKYPFLKKTAEHMKKLGLKIEELASHKLGPRSG
jgi:hypothetical protein